MANSLRFLSCWSYQSRWWHKKNYIYFLLFRLSFLFLLTEEVWGGSVDAAVKVRNFTGTQRMNCCCYSFTRHLLSPGLSKETRQSTLSAQAVDYVPNPHSLRMMWCDQPTNVQNQLNVLRIAISIPYFTTLYKLIEDVSRTSKNGWNGRFNWR